MNYKNERFCDQHSEEIQSCGIQDCPNKRLSESNQACYRAKHQASWQSFLAMKNRNDYLKAQGRKGKGRHLTGNAAKDLLEAEQEAELAVQEEGEDDLKGNTFSFGKTSAIMIFVFACGTVSPVFGAFSDSEIIIIDLCR